MASTNSVSSSTTTKQDVRAVITNCLSSYFSSTLNTEKDIVNLVMAMCQRESSFNISDVGPTSTVSDYTNSQPILNILSSGTSAQKANVIDGRRPWGLMQSMGYNHLKGCSLRNGKTQIEISRPDLVSMLVYAPGTDLSSIFNGASTIQYQIMAGLVMLESKWTSVTQKSGGYSYGTSTTYYSSKIAASIAAYIGVTGADVNGTTADSYVAGIVGGSYYVAANGSNSSGTSSSNLNIASGTNLYTVGC